jgi:hypothetical protein
MRRTLSCLVFGVTVLSGSVSAQDDPNPWPRDILAPNATVTMYQPQLESFEGNTLTARAAVAVDTGGAEPVYGAVWMTASILTDREERTAELVSLDVTRVRFAESDDEHERALATLLETEIPKWSLTLSLDRLQASMALVEMEIEASQALDNTPPQIVYVDEPAVLVSYDGEPNLQQAGEVMVAVNTAFVVLLDLSESSWYLYAGPDVWYESYDALGPWTIASRVPSSVSQMVPDTLTVPEIDSVDTDGAPPKIVTATVSTELISSRGPAEWETIDSTALEVMSNTDSDVLRLGGGYYVLLSGRWYTGVSLLGPWIFVSADSLPDDFSAIPADSDQGYLRAFVAGTEEAQNAVLGNQIPQTAVLDRSQAALTVTYDGNPKFEVIDSTDMQYAINADTPVVLAGGQYYACAGAAWYVAYEPTGPWALADSIPDEIYTLPPSNPTYNCRFVYVFDSNPEEVTVGYYPGYTGSYVHYTTVVYGTGWWYRPWYGSMFFGWPRTWGWGMHWNPWTGWSVGVHGGAFWFGFGSPWIRPGCCWGGWWGPAGYRAGFRHGYHRGRRAGFAAGYRAGQRNNVYRQPRHQSRNAQQQARTQRSTTSSVNRPNNVYADRQGNVHQRNNNGSWQQRNQGTWQPNRTPQANPQQRQQLDRQHQSRQQGAARTQQFQRSRAGGGGARRGGGRRR